MTKTKAKTAAKKTSEPEYIPPDAVPEKDLNRLESNLAVIRDRVESIVIRTRDDYQAAAEVLTTEIKPFIALIGELFDDNVSNWRAGWKAAIAKRKRYLEPIEEIERRIKAAMGEFLTQERRRQEEERQRLLIAQQEAAEEETLQRAKEAMKAGDEDGAEAILASLDDGSVRPVAAPPAIIPRAPKAEGVSGRVSYGFRIVDKSKIDRKFMVPDERSIRQLVKSMGVGAIAVVGEGSIEVYEETTIAAGRR